MENQTVWIMVGIIGAGKSTWSRNMVANDQNVSIVSRDGIREMLNGSYKFIPELEFLIEHINKSVIYDILMSGRDLIIDECHLTKKNRTELVKFIRDRFRDAKIVGVYCPSKTGNVDRRMRSPKNQPRETWQMVYERMLSQFEEPTANEFDEMIVVNTELE